MRLIEGFQLKALFTFDTNVKRKTLTSACGPLLRKDAIAGNFQWGEDETKNIPRRWRVDIGISIVTVGRSDKEIFR